MQSCGYRKNSQISMRAALIALASCAAASALSAPAAAQSSGPAQTRREQAIQAFMARHHLRPRGPGAGFTPSGQFSLGPVHQPPRDAEARSATPAPFFPDPSELTPPANAATGPFQFLFSVSCTSAGNCVAVGLYVDSKGSGQPMIFTETGGVWGQGVEAALPANAAPETAPFSQFAFLDGMTCTSVGNCVAVGNYTDTSGNSQGLIVTETGGVWAQGIELNPQLLPNAGANPFVFLNDVTCTHPGYCAATGGYVDTNGNYQGLVVSETHGVWAQAVEITLPANAAPNPNAGPHTPNAGVVSMGEVSCFSPGNCVAGGQYTDTNYNSQAMIATETNGVWARAIELTLPANASTAEATQNGFLAGLACFSPGNCTAGGGYNDINGNANPQVFNQTHGVWGTGVELTLPANAATAPGAQSAYLNGFRCTSRGNCIGYSAYTDSNGNGQPLVITETGGVWAQGIEPPLPANAATAAGAQDSNIEGVSCTSPGVCAAVGQYVDTNGNYQPMAYTTVPALSIETENLPPATAGADYRARLSADGGAGSNTWSVSAGSLPAGLTLNAATGEISGTPATRGTFSFTITVSDTGTSPGQEASAPFTISVRHW